MKCSLIAIIYCYSILCQHISAEINYNVLDVTKDVYMSSGDVMLGIIDMIYKIVLVIYKIQNTMKRNNFVLF